MVPSSTGLNPDPKFYGRRKGRPLPNRHIPLMENDFPSLSIALPSGGALISPQDYFKGAYDGISLEIGFGGGEHLAARAGRSPHHGFIGIEAFENGVASLVEHITLNNLTNVRIYHDDGRPFLRALKPASIDEIFVLFPDPWPKKRHHKRRLLQKSFICFLRDLLKPGGRLLIATDHADYAFFIHGILTGMTGFGMIPDMSFFMARPADMPPTRYEQKALNAGRHPYYFQMRQV